MKRLLFVGLLAAASCARSPAMQAAESGDRAALKAAVEQQERALTISNGEAASLAFEVADRELRATSGPEAAQRVRDAWSCAHELDGALAARMKTHDEAGAEAALARIDGRGLDLGDARAYLADPDGRWRSVGARGLVRESDHGARMRALRDPDPHVRRQAARAARDATDPSDLEPLAEVARVDPELLVRTEAVRAIAGLKPLPNEGAANLLRDMWSSGDDGLREDIALAWAAPAVWGAGGAGALRVVVASGHGAGAIEAAAAVLRHKDAGGEVAMAARAQIVRSIEQGSRATKLQAIAQAPLDVPEIAEAVEKASDADDVDVRIGALARLAGARRPGSIEKLEYLAQPGSPVAPRARFALAAAGDRRVQAWIEQELASGDPFARLSAATALAELGVYARAAPLLADPDAAVRVRAACVLLMAARSR
jgi:hypothetical protein